MVIAKTMRLNADVPEDAVCKLKGYYDSHGIPEHFGNVRNWALKGDVRRALLLPVYEACRDFDLPFSACVDADVFAEPTSPCLLACESNLNLNDQ
jgi:hypothetical protein